MANPPAPKIRRVITGHDSTGAAVFLSDEMVDSISAGGFSYDPLWATDNAPVVPNDGSIPTGIDFFPAPGGSRVVTWIAEPHGAVAPESTLEEFEAAAPGMASFMEADDPGMHTTPTIDINVVLSGEIWAVMDQDEALLTAGDILIQRGTAHGWENRSDKMARVAFVLIDAIRGGVSRR